MVHIKANELKGLIPAVDPLDVATPYIVRGSNFAMGIKGPVAKFGSNLGAFDVISNPRHATEFLVGAVRYIFTDYGVFGHDADASTFYPVVVFPTAYTNLAPWFGAKVGTKYYFTKDGVGELIQYDPDTVPHPAWTLESPSGLPSGCKALCEAYGRLVVIGDSLNAWSALDNGLDFAPSLATGAGFQSLALIGGTPLGVYETTDGFAVFTDKGIQHAVYNGTPAVWRHDVLSKRHKAVNAFSIQTIQDKEVVFLDKQGFYKITAENNGFPTDYIVELGEHFKDTIVPRTDLTNEPDAFKLHYDDETHYLMVSVRTASGVETYDYAYALYTRLDKIGIFNQPHYSFGQFGFRTTLDGKLNFGFISNGGIIHALGETRGIETAPANALAELVLKFVEFPVQSWEGVYQFPARFRMHTDDTTFIDDLPSGYYQQTTAEDTGDEPDVAPTQTATFEDIDPNLDYENDTNADEDWESSTDAAEDWSGDFFNYAFYSDFRMGHAIHTIAPIRQALAYNSLNAFVEIGPVRLENQLDNDATSQITNVSVGMPDADVVTEVDYETSTDAAVDRESSTTAAEDWQIAADAILPYTYTLAVIPTNDMQNANDLLTVVTEDNDATNVRFYSVAENAAVYHTVKISALTSGEYFQLHSLEARGILTGRL